MARKRKAPDSIGDPQVDPSTGLKLIDQLVKKGRELLESPPLSENAHEQWELLARNYLEKTFGTNSPNVNAVTKVGKFGSFPMGAGEAWWEQHRVESLTTQLTRLEGLVELLTTELQILNEGTIQEGTIGGPKGHRIFLVHGHNRAATEETARFLEKLVSEVIVLREQPNRGRTIIEKFEDFADVGFAVVLLTPDDRGGESDGEFDSQRPRARQNVILELGYFLGRLGRSRVCALYTEGVEIPSDYSGVLYVQLDDEGAWRLNLAKELKSSGIPIDMNAAV